MSSSPHIEEMVSRIDDVTDAINEILREDPIEILAKRKAREERRQHDRERREAEKLDRVKMRYEPKFFSRFERDDLIDALLKEADGGVANGGAQSTKMAAVSPSFDLSLYAKSEKISIEEAQKLRAEAAKSVQQADWARAESQYTSAIKLITGMEVDDEPVRQLLTVLRNNRALVRNKLAEFMGAVEDATYVLSNEPQNAKALLRRATALRHLHRPVEALKDVAAVLEREPRNAEALQQQLWLEKAETELAECERFVAQDAKDERGRGNGDVESAALQLCRAIEVVQAFQAQNSSTSAGDAAKGLLTVSQILDMHFTGAATLFAVRGGVTPTAQLALSALLSGKTDDAQCAVLLQALAVLSRVLELSDVASQDASPAVMTDLVTKLVSSLAIFVSGSITSLAPSSWSLAGASLLCLSQLGKGYPSTVVRALDKSPVTDLLVKVFHRTTAHSPALLHSYLSFLSAILLNTTAEQSQDVEAVDRLLFMSSRADGEKEAQPLILAAASAAFSVQANSSAVRSALRLQGLQYILRVTCFSASALCQSDARRCRLTAFLCSRAFAKELYAMAVTALCPATRGTAAELDALYAVIYNVILTAPDRQQYLKDTWLSPGLVEPTLFAMTLEFLLAQPTPTEKAVSSSFLFVPACSSMLATLAKLCPNVKDSNDQDGEFVAVTVVELAKAEPKLWVLLEVVAEQLNSASPSQLAQSLAEHLVSILGYLSIHRKGTKLPSSVSTKPFLRFSDDATGSTGPAALDALFACLKAGKCFTEAAVVALNESGRATPQVSPLILLGSAALLLSSVVERFPNSIECYHVLAGHKAIDVLLPILREARTSLLLLKREAAKGENASIKHTLDLWVQHTAQAQQNLCIAIGKVCAVQGTVVESQSGEGDSLLDRLHKLNGFETLAAAFNKK